MNWKLVLLPTALAAITHAAPPLDAVPAVDLGRYAGVWHEIARFPNRFQRACVSDTTAQYTLRPDGKVTVLNRCRTAEGKSKSAQATARVPDPKAPAKLKVTFFWPFSGDYWIVGLDPDYGWALVGEPKRDYLWILAREPQLPPDVLAKIEALAREKGFETTRLVRTPHTGR